MTPPLLFLSAVVIFNELYLLTKNSAKKCQECLVGNVVSTTFASAFRKEGALKTIFE